MNQQTLLSELSEIFNEVLDKEGIVLKPDTHAGDIEEWDSLTHIQLIVAIEKHYKIRFTSLEIQHWKNVGDICQSILDKTM
ncbi:MAG TPA: acyl carrier protein [Marinilabiliales bacterium]|nr:MAG: acyl carrier protein [Bacteroidetes bacterium GWA2_40_14]OFX63577.1 MAG: acyl carrier protein [Bacteroidetes bacterium GWC2_40_13]OFX73277.1 MAG: acyl carrier protein [Bacteroidetes bacterium GWD2_40_43]OFX92132.1 MAG: acyl carrier protein [Bacteroidetes bacterium GWE2_40_63]OFY24298.1 MAG: acyl carrier protein [Bacteroidetes bacterium GWF2_40_13]OFZ28921.1 MAG: acyl carrier protein [Bacteroidetes bacterium RIFOXYC2_FULL_40_12]HAM98976.1 acyl carrier protein [Marinilabiliales bacteriu